MTYPTALPRPTGFGIALMPRLACIANAFAQVLSRAGWDHAWWYSGHLDAELMDVAVEHDFKSLVAISLRRQRIV